MTAIVLFDDNAYYTLGFTNDKQELKVALQNIHSTGGEYYYAESSDMLTDLYEKIYVYESMDKTDDDDEYGLFIY